MNKYSLSEISSFIDGDLFGNDKNVSKFSIDSRTINQGDAFICIKGIRYDGHDFIKDSLKKASCIISSKKIIDIDLKNKSYILVKDTEKALHKISEFIRLKSNAKFVAITGSNGKTTVKEMLAYVLSDYKITYTQGNLNNHIGVPLTLLSSNQDDDYVIVEIGANGLNEIEPLSKIVKPNVAVVTNIGYAHIEGFGTLNNTAKEKYSIFKHLLSKGTAIINFDDKYSDIVGKKNKIFFGYDQGFIKKLLKKYKNIFYKTSFSLIKKTNEDTFNFTYKKFQKEFSLKLNGEHNFSNAACVISIAIALGLSPEDIQNKIETFESVHSRLKIYLVKNDIKLIDDCYNANPSSFKAALSFLAKSNQKKLVLMGDMVELGEESESFHSEIGEYAKEIGIDEFLSIGKYSENASNVFGENGHHFKDAESLKSYLNNNLESSSCILIKGSRSAKLEEYVEFLKMRV